MTGLTDWGMAAVKSISEGVITTDTQGNVTFMNPAAEILTGLSREEALGKKLSAVCTIVNTEEDIPGETLLVKTLKESVTIYQQDSTRLITMDGKEIPIANYIAPIRDAKEEIIGAVLTFREISKQQHVAEELKQSEKNLKRNSKILATLNAIILTTNSSSDLEVMLTSAMEQIVQLTGSDGAECHLVEPSGILELVAHYGLDAEFVDKSQQVRLRPNEGILGQVFSGQSLLCVPDISAEALYCRRKLAHVAGYRSLLCVPIFRDEASLGTLTLYSRELREIRTDILGQLITIGKQLNLAIEHARLYDQAQQERAECIETEQKALKINDKLSVLQYVGATIAASRDLPKVLDIFVLEMVNLLEVTGCIILRWGRDVNSVMTLKSYGTALKHKGGAPGAVHTSSDFPALRASTIRRVQQMTIGQPDIEPDLLSYMQEMHLKTLLILPMEFSQQLIGFIELMDDQVERTFAFEELGFAQLLANQAASTIVNIQLNEQIKKELAERQKVEQELRWVATKSQTIISAISDSLFYLNRSGEILDFKPMPNVSMIQKKVAPGMNLADAFVLSSDYRSQLLYYIDQTFDSGETQTFECQQILPTGNQDIEVRLFAQGPNEVLAIVRNITKRKQAERILRESEAKFRTLFNSSYHGFILIDQHGKIQAFNKIASEWAKMMSEKTLQEEGSIHEILSDADFAEFDHIFNKVLQGETISVERLITTEGTEKWFEYNYTPVSIDGRQIIGVCFSTTDIDSHKRVTDVLLAREGRLLAEMQSVLFTTNSLISDDNLSHLLSIITGLARYLINRDGAAILLLSEDKQQLEVVHSNVLSAGLKMSVQGSLAELAITNHRIYASDLASKNGEPGSSFRMLLKPSEVGSLLCAPLAVRSKPLGVLLIWGRRREVFTDHDMNMIKLFAAQAALAIQNATQFIRSRELAIEQERHRLARDLHDTVTQSLYSIGMASLAALKRLNKDVDTKIQEPIKHIHQLAQFALREIRIQIYNLHPTTLEGKQLDIALKQYCDVLKEQHALKVDLMIDPEIQLSVYQRDGLYYIAREALSNVVKHAGNARTKVVLESSNKYVTLRIEDEGVGFVTSASLLTETVGLRSMMARTELLGGSFELQSKPGSGTRITAQIPR